MYNKGVQVMNLLDYTKKLAEKIRFYDSIAQPFHGNFNSTNPFAKPISVTIIWVEDEK